jgi:diaminohydroxyphosphoribosylaminopyrimidine deaminase/5-amino-6-(5-phosphoribosylamino)uracil reductase
VTTDSDLHFMRLAYSEALKAVGNADPNPAVGAIVVNAAGEVIATGATQRAGFGHAERVALQKLKNTDLSTCTLYVTLEPCCHFGRTPPCTDAILERKIKRVVIAERDFAAEVRGESVALLQAAGVDTQVLPEDLFAREKWFTTEPFKHARRTAMPHVILKWAQTQDGSLAPETGSSGEISGNHAAFATAALRSLFKLTVATPGVVRSDNPKLTVRFAEGIPNGFAGAGLSAFFEALLAAQPAVATDLENNAATTSSKAALRAFMIAQSDEKIIETVRRAQSALSGAHRIFPVNLAAFRDNFAATFKVFLRQIVADGFNSVFLEAGPGFSDLVVQNGLADAIVIYQSRAKNDVMLWSKPGRGNSLSRALAAASALPKLEGFELLERATWPQDEFFFFVKS